VSEVWSAGRHIVTGGEHIRAEAIRARFAQVMAQLMQAL
jgi:formimidoylglutamate deiminase